MCAMPSTDTWTDPSARSVGAIAGLHDPALRNLWITETYAQLADDLGASLGVDQSWCSFAIWASDTAGVSIREREVPRLLADLPAPAHEQIDHVVDHVARRHRHWHRIGLVDRFRRVHVVEAIGHALTDVREHIAHGNTLVFSELAPLFVAFRDRRLQETPPTGAGLDGWLDDVGIPAADDQPLVRHAFEQYVLASVAGDDLERAQRVLAANVSAVLHEQQRLQDDVGAALDAGLVDIARAVEQTVGSWVPGPVRRWLAARAGRGAERHVERLWDHVTTELLMTLAVPGEVLHLGRDVPPLPDGERWPAALAEPDLPTLVDLLDTWDPTGGTGIGSGASDWADLHQRMGYIVNLFRSRQQTGSLTSSPFTGDQLHEMRSLRVPDDLVRRRNRSG